MEEIWQELTAWLEQHGPTVLENLNPGASEAEIEQTEAFVRASLPDEFKALYRLCNGQKQLFPNLFLSGEFLSLSEVRREWEIWYELWEGGDFAESQGEPSPAIRDGWWNPGWIPLTRNGAGDNYCVDLTPTDEGTYGQIITMWHDFAPRWVEADSLTDFLAQIAEGLEAGDLAISAKYGVVEAGEENDE